MQTEYNKGETKAILFQTESDRKAYTLSRTYVWQLVAFTLGLGVCTHTHTHINSIAYVNCIMLYCYDYVPT